MKGQSMERYLAKPTGFGNRKLSYNVKVLVARIRSDIDFFDIERQQKQQNLNGGRMKIKFDRYENAKTKPNAAGKTYSMYRVFGTALEGKMSGQEWSTQFFASARDLASQVKELKKGDTVNVRLEQNGQFWNPMGFQKVADEGTSASPSQSVNANSAPTQIASSAPDQTRLTNFKLALEMIGPKPKAQDVAEYLSNVATYADLVQDYVDKKGMFQFDKATSKGVPDFEIDPNDVETVESDND